MILFVTLFVRINQVSAVSTQGNTFYSDGTTSRTGITGTTVRVFATQAAPNISYKLVSGKNNCTTDLVPINNAVVTAGQSGLLPTVSGPVDRSAGVWDICFAESSSASPTTTTSVISFTIPETGPSPVPTLQSSYHNDPCMGDTCPTPTVSQNQSTLTHFLDSWITWPEKSGGYDIFDALITPESDGSPDGYFFAHYFQFTNYSGNGGYLGLQTEGAGIGGKAAIFSIWDATDSTGPEIARPFGGEGIGQQTLIHYNWVVGKTYRLRVFKSASPDWWEAEVQDIVTDISTPIGKIKVPVGRGGLGASSAVFHERYSGTDSCGDLKYSSVRFNGLNANDGQIWPIRHVNTTSPICSDRVVTTDIEQGIRSQIGIIPGTLSPTAPPASCDRSNGDADCNGSTNLADFEQWRKEFTKETTSLFADFNSDGKSDLVDFEIWRKSFFANSLNPSPTVVPTTVSVITPTTAPTVLPSPAPTSSSGFDLSRCTISATNGNEIVNGSEGDDVICILSDRNVVYAKGGNDTIYINGSNNYIDAGAGNDTILLGSGKTSDYLLGGDGNDTINASLGGGSNYIDGAAGTDACVGKANDVKVNCEQ